MIFPDWRQTAMAQGRADLVLAYAKDAPAEAADPRGPVVWTWKEIARVLGRSVDYAQSRADRDIDPLPVFWEDDRPGAHVGMLLMWRQNQRRSHKYHREIQARRSGREPPGAGSSGPKPSAA